MQEQRLTLTLLLLEWWTSHLCHIAKMKYLVVFGSYLCSLPWERVTK